MLVAKAMGKPPGFDSFPKIFKCLQPQGWAAWYCAAAQGKEKGCCGISGEIARALPSAAKTNIAPWSLPWNGILSETNVKLACLPWKRFYIKQVGCCSQVLFQLPLGQHCCSIGLNVVKYSVHGWETNPLFTFFFFDKKIWMQAVIRTRLVYLKPLYSQERWKLYQRKRNGQKRLERCEPSLDQA